MSVASLADVLPAEALSEGGAGSGLATGRAPDAVVHPETTEEVAATVGWAAANDVGVLPVASGRRVSGRAPDRPFVLLRTDRLRGIELHEPADLTLTARAGTTLADLSERLGAHGQWLPFDPPLVVERSLGGLVARGESGPAWVGYGELRNHVLGMTVVTGEGRTLHLGGRVVKNVAGFDLIKPLVGSRGRLAIITSVCVRAFPRPAVDRLLVLRAGDAGELCDVASAVGTAPVLPASSVLVAPMRTLGADAALLVRLHGSTSTVEADQHTLERHCGVTFERPGEAAEPIAEARDAVSEEPAVLVVAVLPSRLREALAAIDSVLPAGEGGRVLVADTYLGRVRVACAAVDTATATVLRTHVEGLGGSLSIGVRAGGDGPGGDDLIDAASTPSRDEAQLLAGLERVFDPRGVFWPCRL